MNPREATSPQVVSPEGKSCAGEQVLMEEPLTDASAFHSSATGGWGRGGDGGGGGRIDPHTQSTVLVPQQVVAAQSKVCQWLYTAAAEGYLGSRLNTAAVTCRTRLAKNQQKKKKRFHKLLLANNANHLCANQTRQGLHAGSKQHKKSY